MKRYIEFKGKSIQYELEYKRVKNINLRIKADGIFVSAPRSVTVREIEGFLRAKQDFITKATQRIAALSQRPRTEYFSRQEIEGIIIDICKKIYPHFESRGIKYPVIKFRKMVSRWGSCNYVKGIITFNTSLMYAPHECIEYVVIHEFCHLLQGNHSPLFYAEVERLCPDYKRLRKVLKGISIR